MLHKFWKSLVRSGTFTSPKYSRKFPSRQVTPILEQLYERLAPAVTASFLPGAGVLSVFGDAADNTITISRNAAGRSSSTAAPWRSRAARPPSPTPR